MRNGLFILLLLNLITWNLIKTPKKSNITRLSGESLYMLYGKMLWNTAWMRNDPTVRGFFLVCVSRMEINRKLVGEIESAPGSWWFSERTALCWREDQRMQVCHPLGGSLSLCGSPGKMHRQTQVPDKCFPKGCFRVLIRRQTYFSRSFKAKTSKTFTAAKFASAWIHGRVIRTHQNGAGAREDDLRRKDIPVSSAVPLSSWGQEPCREELLEVGAQDAKIWRVVYASAVDGALQQAVDKLPLDRFTSLDERQTVTTVLGLRTRTTYKKIVLTL